MKQTREPAGLALAVAVVTAILIGTSRPSAAVEPMAAQVGRSLELK